MKVKCIMGAVLGLMLMLSVGKGQTGNERWTYSQNAADNFNAPDVTLDMFGTWADRNRFGADNENFGGGLGVSAYFLRYLGISADSYIEEWKVPYRINGDLLLRIPLGQTGLAPYGMGGGGRQWKYVPQWSWNAGGGLQFKLNPYAALFGDWRRVFPEDTDDYQLVRFGVNVGF